MTRALIRLDGPDASDFLQGLITNDVGKTEQAPIYAALLTPQGKYLADFFVLREGDALLIDIAADLAPGLIKRLTMYKLRADVTIAPLKDLHLHRGTGAAPEDGWSDPRHPALGWRAWRSEPQTDDNTDWETLRVQHLIPETGKELTPDSYILEQNFEALNGVDFRKGCYVGQEVTARMKHKTELKKGLARVSLAGPTEFGAEIEAGGKVAGQLLSRAGTQALAYLRFDRIAENMRCGDAEVTHKP